MVDVFVAKIKNSQYPEAPFHPDEIFPEFSNTDLVVETNTRNEVYRAIREIFVNLGFDSENFGTANWNPLKELVKPGERVMLKPNFVKGNHPLGLNGVLSMITHASVMRPVIDYLLLATRGKVEIIIGDVPLQSAVWDEIIKISEADRLVAYYSRENIRLLDMRREIAIFNEENVIIKKKFAAHRQKKDYVTVDLGRDSALQEIQNYSEQLEITDYGYGTVPRHHNAVKNEYLIAREILEADCIINLPKMKTHRKAGITCAMKNLIGINGDKSWIAHHRRGLPKDGGDEFEFFKLRIVMRERFWNFIKTKTWGIWLATLLKKMYKILVWKGKSYEEVSMYDGSSDYREGNWSGNDTVWRCIQDLNQILLYADPAGIMHTEKQRNYFCLVDAVMSGEKEGPMEHLPKKTGLLIGSSNPVAVDFAVAEIMGFDYRLIPSINKSFSLLKYPLIHKKPEDILILANCERKDYHFQFIPPKGWKKIMRQS
ncbi:MAG: DUF362 domain-containing protein [Candidatus Marinimicrobia bacterium]|nr:DUF362 domain-containing protein [Candidatus Neomarinimicrobiota bacterium]